MGWGARSGQGLWTYRVFEGWGFLARSETQEVEGVDVVPGLDESPDVLLEVTDRGPEPVDEENVERPVFSRLAHLRGERETMRVRQNAARRQSSRGGTGPGLSVRLMPRVDITFV